MLLPLIYLLLRAAEAPLDEVQAMLLRPRNFTLLANTALLAVGVIVGATAIGLPLAWLVSRTDLRGRRALTVLAVLPLAVPGYVMAWSLLGIGGPRGALAGTLGLEAPRLSGYWGALIALTLYNFPYVFLTTRAAFERLDHGPTEAARALGAGRLQVLFGVQLRQLAPALLAGGLLVGLYAVGDFGVVSLMRYDTLSYALFVNWAEMQYAAWLALWLLAFAGVLLGLDWYLGRNQRVSRVGVGAARRAPLVRLGRWSLGAWIAVVLVVGLSLLVPLSTTLYWLAQGLERFVWADLGQAALDSLTASLPAALLTVSLALPLAFLAQRYPGWASRLAERTGQLGYAVPALALALALVFFCLRVAPALRDSMLVLLLAYAAHFLLLAMGPMRGTLHLLTPRHEEAARALGCGPAQTLWRVTLPALRGAMVAGLILVFLAAMRELPLSKLLSPLDFRTLAVNAWSFADEALYADAAPYALSMLLVSGAAVALMLQLDARRVAA